MSITLKELNPTQLEAVKGTDQHILILAGAGSGKTRTLTYRIAHLIQQKKVDPASILAVTFTNKAAREMKERVAELVKNDLTKIWLGTFHSMFARLLRIEVKNIAFDSDFTIYDTDDQVNAIKKVMSILNIPQQLHSPKLFQSRISNLKNRMLEPDQLESSQDENFDSLLPDVYRRYNDFLRDNNALDFDDLLILPGKLFDEHPHV